MNRIIAAVIAGGIALFIWYFVSWVALPIHSATIKQIPQEDAALAMLHSTIPEKGVYYFPGLGAENRNAPGAMEKWTAKYRSGPIGFLVYDPDGNEPLNLPALTFSLFFDFLAVAVGVWLFRRSTAPLGGYFSRAAYFGVLGALISLAVYMQEWIHMKYPLSYSLAFCADALIGWLFAGLVIAAILKPVAQSKATPNN